MTREGSKTGATFGPVLVAVAAFFLYFARDLHPAGLAKSDPGPRFWPEILALCLLMLGIGYTVYAAAMWLFYRGADAAGAARGAGGKTGGERGEQPKSSKELKEPKGQPPAIGEAADAPPFSWVGLLTDWGLQNVVLLSVALAVYAAAIGWLGYAVSSIAFATLMMARLGQPAVAKTLQAKTGEPAAAWKTWLATFIIATLIATVLVVLIVLLFDRVFSRPLPHGDMLGMPF